MIAVCASICLFVCEMIVFVVFRYWFRLIDASLVCVGVYVE